MSGIARQVVLLLATLLTLTMNYLSQALPLFGRSNADVSSSLPNAFTPAGLTFAVWGPIFLGLLTFAVYQALPAQRGPRLDRLFWPFLLGNLLNAGWLLAFQSLHYGLSVLIMLGLLLSLIWLYLRVQALGVLGAPGPQGRERWTLGLPVSLYLAWISVATIADITAYAVSRGLTSGLLGLSAPVWSALLLVVAGLIGVFFLVRFRDYAFGLVLLWAFYGVYVARPGLSTVVMGVIVSGVLVVAGSVLAARRGAAALA